MCCLFLCLLYPHSSLPLPFPNRHTPCVPCAPLLEWVLVKCMALSSMHVHDSIHWSVLEFLYLFVTRPPLLASIHAAVHPRPPLPVIARCSMVNVPHDAHLCPTEGQAISNSSQPERVLRWPPRGCPLLRLCGFLWGIQSQAQKGWLTYRAYVNLSPQSTPGLLPLSSCTQTLSCVWRLLWTQSMATVSTIQLKTFCQPAR